MRDGAQKRTRRDGHCEELDGSHVLFLAVCSIASSRANTTRAVREHPRNRFYDSDRWCLSCRGVTEPWGHPGLSMRDEPRRSRPPPECRQTSTTLKLLPTAPSNA